jgi:hypothetical protein
MKLSKHIEQLQKQFEKEGEMEVTMLATTLPIGYSADGTVGGNLADVFISTVETVMVQEHPTLGKTLQLYYQM